MKTKTRYLLLCIVTISIIVVGLIFLPLRWPYLILIAFIVGSVVLTEEWNLLRVHSQRQNLVRAVVQEWVINDKKMKSPPLTGRVEDSNYLVYGYTMFSTSALNAVLSSGLWNYGESNENRFLTAVSSYEMAISAANQCFYSTNETLFRNISVKERIDEAVSYQSQTLQSQWYSVLKIEHEGIRKLLATEYRWAMIEQMDTNTRKALLESEKGQTQNQPSSLDKH